MPLNTVSFKTEISGLLKELNKCLKDAYIQQGKGFKIKLNKKICLK